MNIADIIKLTMNGYTTDQIREMKELSAQSPELLDYAKSGKSFEDVKSIIELSGDLSKEDPVKEQKEPAESVQTPPDNKNDDLIKENEKLKEQVKQLQIQNQFTDQSGKLPEDPMANLSAVVASCM